MEKVGVVFEKEEKVYEYLNKNNLDVKIGDIVIVQKKDGGVSTVTVVDIKSFVEKKKSDYMSILEVITPSNKEYIPSSEVREGTHLPVCLVRVMRKQWDEKEYVFDWSDILVKFLFELDDNIKIGEIFQVNYGSSVTKGRVVGFSSVKFDTKSKLNKITRPKKSESLFKRTINIFKRT
jgi:hypothetical protein